MTAEILVVNTVGLEAVGVIDGVGKTPLTLSIVTDRSCCHRPCRHKSPVDDL